MFNPDYKIVFGISVPLNNVLPNELNRNKLFEGANDEKEVIKRIKNAKAKVYNSEYPKEIDSVVSQIRAIAMSSTLY